MIRKEFRKSLALPNILLLLCVSILLRGTAFGLSERIKPNDFRSPEPVIKKYYPECRPLQLKDLDRDLQDYFVANYPNLNPGYLSSDFNGDNILDYTFLLVCEQASKTVIRFIVLMGEKDSAYDLIEIQQWSEQPFLKNLYLHIVRPGNIKEWDSSRTVSLKFPCIELVLFESASRVYYWGDGKFKYIQTSD